MFSFVGTMYNLYTDYSTANLKILKQIIGESGFTFNQSFWSCHVSTAAGEEPAVRGWEDDCCSTVLQLREQHCCGAHWRGESLCWTDEGMVSSPPYTRAVQDLKIYLSTKKSPTITFDNVSSQAVWKSILSNVTRIEDSTDFFKSGAASMDVVR